MLRDGIVVKNPAIAAYLEKLGLETSEEEALLHEAAEVTLEQANNQGILTTQMLLDHLEATQGYEGVQRLKSLYNRHWGYAGTFDNNPGYALRHILAECHDNGHIPDDIREFAMRLYTFSDVTLGVNRFSWIKLTSDDVRVLDEDSPEVTAAQKVIADVDKAIKAIREAHELPEGPHLKLLAELKQESDTLGDLINIADADFHSSDIDSDNISQQLAQELAVVIPADVVLNHLLGFKKERKRLANVPVFIITTSDDETKKVNRFMELGFLPKNILVASHRGRDFVAALSSKKRAIALGFSQSLKACEINHKRFQSPLPNDLKIIKFSEVGENQLLSWKRAFDNIAVAVLQEDPGRVATGLSPDVIQKLLTRQDISDFQVGVQMTTTIFERSRRLYEYLKENV